MIFVSTKSIHLLRWSLRRVVLKERGYCVWKSIWWFGFCSATRFKFNVGDRVRIVKRKKVFEKGYSPRWTVEVFTTSKQQHTKHRPRIRLHWQRYSRHVLWTGAPTYDVYRIEKAIKSKGNKLKVLVKWKGHPADEFNSWIDKNELIACYRFVRVVRGIYLTWVVSADIKPHQNA